MNDSHVKGKLTEIFENTIESGELYDGPCDTPEYYNLFCKAASKDQLFKLMNNNLCMFNCKYKDEDSVIMIFSIPINSGESGAKNIAERVMRVITAVEECFITLDFVKSEEVKEDKFIYIIAVKKVKP
ncbi:MAG: hypothetical protein ACTSX6_02150 [Candidatus Heimdallarchaeaceae archaeon]